MLTGTKNNKDNFQKSDALCISFTLFVILECFLFSTTSCMCALDRVIVFE